MLEQQTLTTLDQQLWDLIVEEKVQDLIKFLANPKGNIDLNKNNPAMSNLTPLQYTAKKGLKDIANTILAYDIDINKGSQPALHLAVIARNISLVNLLLSQAKIDLLKKDDHGYYALQYCAIVFKEEAGFFKNKNQQAISEIISIILKKHIEDSIPVPLNLLYKKSLEHIDNAEKFDLNPIKNQIYNILKTSNNYQHLILLGKLWLNKDVDGEGVKYLRQAATLLLKLINPSQEEITYIKLLKNITFDDKVPNSPTDDYYKQSALDQTLISKTYFDWRLCEELDFAQLWLNLAKQRVKPINAPVEVNFPFDCYLRALYSLSASITKVADLKCANVYDRLTAKNILVDGFNFLKNLSNSDPLKKRGIILLTTWFYDHRPFIYDFSKYHIFNNSECFNEILNVLTAIKTNFDLNYILAMLCGQINHKDYKKYEQLIPDNHPLKTFITDIFNINNSSIITSSKSICSTLENLKCIFMQNITESDLYYDEFIFTENIVKKILEGYSNHKNALISGLAKNILAQVSLPSAPIDGDVLMSSPDEKTHHFVPTSTTTIPAIEKELPTVPLNYTDLTEAIYPNKNIFDTNYDKKQENIINVHKLSPDQNEKQASIKNPLVKEKQFEDNIITKKLNENQNSLDVIMPSKIAEKEQEVDNELESLQKRITELKQKKVRLKNIKKFLQQGNKISAEELAKFELQKRYEQFFITKDSSSSDDNQKKIPVKPDPAIYKNPYRP